MTSELFKQKYRKENSSYDEAVRRRDLTSQILDMRAEGITMAEIAKKLGIPQRKCTALLKTYRNEMGYKISKIAYKRKPLTKEEFIEKMKPIMKV